MADWFRKGDRLQLEFLAGQSPVFEHRCKTEEFSIIWRTWMGVALYLQPVVDGRHVP